ncbi:hypothetical protein [Streptomyces sp. NPDC054794]
MHAAEGAVVQDAHAAVDGVQDAACQLEGDGGLAAFLVVRDVGIVEEDAAEVAALAGGENDELGVQTIASSLSPPSVFWPKPPCVGVRSTVSPVRSAPPSFCQEEAGVKSSLRPAASSRSASQAVGFTGYS